MEPQAILLLALAALIHSGWNLLAKRSLDAQAFLWLALAGTCVLFVPPFLYLYTPIRAEGWALILLSGALESAYFILLASAYQRGDLSLVYPLARGSAPLFVVIFAALFLDERVYAGGIVGIALVVAGIYTLHLKSLTARGLAAPFLAFRERISQLAVLTGVVIASYAVVDKVGVSYVAPLPYAFLVLFTSALMLAPYMLITRRAALAREWSVNKGGIIAVAAMSPATYVMTLWVMTFSKVSYVSSVREMSVVFAALLGTFLLREPFGKAKIVGSLLIFAGIVAIGLAR